MRLSIWNQFSSNHSGSFTIIGEFGTSEEAEKIANKLWEWLQQMFPKGMTELEQKISETYNLAWYPNGVDWNGKPESMDEAVIRVGSKVFLTTGTYETWNDAIPFVGLMWKLGSKEVLYASNEIFYLGVHLTCLAPNEKAADEFYDQVNTYLRDNSPIRLPPWGDKTNRAIGKCWGYIYQKEREIQMGLQFWEAASGFRVLMKYLHEQGFTEITYGFGQDKYWDEQILWHFR